MHTRLLLTALLVLTLAACSSPSPDGNLTETVEAQGEAIQTVRARLVELEDGLTTVLATDQTGEFRSLSETVAGIEEALASLDDLTATLDERVTGTEDLVAETASGVSALDEELLQLNEQISSLTSSFSGLREDLDSLADDLGSLQTQFQRHRDDDDVHDGS